MGSWKEKWEHFKRPLIAPQQCALPWVFPGTTQVLEVQVNAESGREIRVQARAEALQIQFTAWFYCECFSRSHTIT